MLRCVRVGGLVAFVFVASALGCTEGGSEVRTTGQTTEASPPPETRPQQQGVPPRATVDEAKAVIGDWYDNGKIDATHRCDAVRAAIELLPASGEHTVTAREDLRRVEAVLCSRESRPQTRPRWVDAAVADVRRRFAGYPSPVRVTWGESSVKRWATVVVAQPELCNTCSGPPDADPTRLKRVTIYYKRRGMLVTGLSGRTT